MDSSKLIVEEETELLALHRVLLEAKFNLSPSDNQIQASPFTAALAQRVLRTIVGLQSATDVNKIERWSNWLEQKKDWIWERCLSYMLRNQPSHWIRMDYVTKRDYVQWLFSPYALHEEDVERFIDEVEKYRQAIEKGHPSFLRSFGNATDAILDDLEQKINRKLPQGYRTYLRNHNGGKVLVHYCTFAVEELNEIIPLHVIFGVQVEKRYDLAYWNMFKDEFPTGHILIGEAAAGGKILMDDLERIYYWRDMDYDDPTRNEGLYKVADNFDAFQRTWKRMIKTM
ncbi:SMI1/KNR4 family protein [Paenibacillus sp. DCT19]|uniref:SMI1/KNR4 family protein n=1 Tax=Paenibacillus sp. DCT19 TaxID=2211212 RepID=UPI000FE224AF|nr:SMI1/KNR4 family protein [Paenibacillus sp. DCT19]